MYYVVLVQWIQLVCTFVEPVETINRTILLFIFDAFSTVLQGVYLAEGIHCYPGSFAIYT